MQLLQISPFSAYPPSKGGEHRVHGLTRGIESDDHLDRYVHSIVLLNDKNNIWISDNYREIRYRSLLQYIHSGITGKLINAPPIYSGRIMEYSHPEILDSLLEQADAILVETPWLFPSIYNLKPEDTPIVYSSHNYEPDFFPNLERHCAGKIILKRIKKLERFATINADLTVVTSKRDRTSYQKFNESGPFQYIPNSTYRDGVTNLYSKPRPGLEIDLNITDHDKVALFVGSDTPFNREAVRNILRINDSSKLQEANVNFVIIGDVCNAFQNNIDNIHFLGFVDNLKPYYQLADLAVNPITTGGGSNVKIPEYFSKGLPVLSTPYGSRGVPAEPGIEIFISDLEDFAGAIIELFDSPGSLDMVSDNCLRLVENYLNWENVSSDLLDRISDELVY